MTKFLDPQVIRAGDWKVYRSEQPAVDLKRKELFVPLEATAQAEAFRAHELGHVKFSRAGDARFNRLPEYQAIEDVRVNKMLLDRGIAMTEVMTDPGEIAAVLDGVAQMTETDYGEGGAFYAGTVWLACEGVGVAEHVRREIAHALSAYDVDFLNKLLAKIEAGKADPETSIQAAREFKEYFRKRKEQEPEQPQGGGDKPPEPEEPPPSDPQGGQQPPEPEPEPEEPGAKSEAWQALKEELNRREHRQSEKELCAQLEQVKGGRLAEHVAAGGVWGNMSIERPALTRPQRGALKLMRKQKASDYGTALRYPARYVTDKQVFGRKKRAPGGTVLLDLSGSMDYTGEQIGAILDALPDVTVLGYSGCSGMSHEPEGWLLVLAEHGRRVAEIPELKGGNNGVDLPAIEHMVSRYASPYYYITDCEWRCFARVGDRNVWNACHLTPEQNAAVKAAVKKNKVLIVPSLAALERKLGRPGG